MIPPASPDVGRDPEKRLRQFDRDWRSAAPPRLEDYLAGAPGREYVEELIAIDLEYRWRKPRPANVPPRLEEYVARFPALGPLDLLSARLVGREYEIRRSWGDRPERADYQRRFAARWAEIEAELTRVDADLAAELACGTAAPACVVSLPPASSPAMPSTATLIDTLQKHAILDRARLDELGGMARKGDADPVTLARDLLKRGWLTAYQANQLLLGRGAELVLGQFLILERLGEGGAGQVFKARQQRLGRVVALKLIRRETLADPEMVQRFYREIRIISQLAHVNIVKASDAGPAGATHFLAMEYIEGIDLARLVKQSGPLRVAEAVDYTRQTALGLQHAHEQGLVHRDIKPHNLLLAHGDDSAPGIVKILDLGLARLRPVEGALESTGVSARVTPDQAVMMGTPDYLAPEQALDFHAADVRADIYSLGCTLFFLLTGQPPFPGGTLAQKLIHHQQQTPPALEALRPDAPPALGAVLAKMLAKRPEDRYQTPAAVAAALAALGTHSPRTPWRDRRIQVAMLAAGLLLVGLFSLWLRTGSTAPRVAAPVARPFVLAEGLGAVDGLVWLDGRTVAVAARGGITIWDTETKQSSEPEAGLRIQYLGKFVGEDGAPVLAGWDKSYKSVQTWRRPGWRRQTLLDSVPMENSKARFFLTRPVALAVAPDGAWVAAASARAVKVWQFPAQMSVGTTPPDLGAEDSGGPVACNPKRRQFASAFGKTAYVWNWEPPAPANHIQVRLAFVLAAPPAGHTQRITTLAYSPDGKKLATAGADLVVKVWDPDQRQCLHTLAGHTANVLDVAFGPDGKSLAAAAADGNVLVWDTTSGQMKLRIPAHPSAAQSVAFSPTNSNTCATGGADGRVIRWHWE